MPTKIEQKQKTRKNLIDAFLKLNSESPIEQIRIVQIVELAGCHRSTFYEHFLDIYDLRSQEEEELLSLQRTHIITPALNGKLNIFNTQEFMGRFNEIYQMKSDSLMTFFGRYGDPDFQKRFKDNIADTLFKLVELDGEARTHMYLIEFITAGMFAVLNRLHEQQDIEFKELFAFLHPISSKLLSIALVKD